MIWNALILAGSRQGAQDPIAELSHVSHKALAPIAGRAMIDYVLEALHKVPEIKNIAVSIEPTTLIIPDGAVRLEAEPSPALSVLAGLEKLGTPLFVTTADNPLIDPSVVSLFLNQVRQQSLDVAAGVSLRHFVEQAGNPARRTYLRFSDGDMSGCNLFAFQTKNGSKAATFWRRLETDRKKPWQMASKIGPGILFRYLFKRLDSQSATHAISKKIGCTTGLITIDNIYAAHDVDKPDDLVFVERHLKSQRA